VLQSISAKSDGEACCQWVGDEGAGHYVKMVHNGIEYGDMQLICEVRMTIKEKKIFLANVLLGLRHHEAWSRNEGQGNR
jgi:6-phosphogluconate dehydrogenase